MEKYGNTNEHRTENFSPEMVSSLVRKTSEVNSEHSLNMEQFIDTFGIEKVKADYALVADKMQEHLQGKMSDSEKLGHIYEAAFLDSASRHKWFGDRSEITKASKYDDIMNGIDMVTTIMDEKNSAKHFEVSSDLTISKHGAAEKFNRIANDVRRGKLATLNYFHSDLIGFTGKISDVPRTVVSLDRENLNRFLTNWLKEPEMAQEQMGRLMLSQISSQADGFAGLAQNVHGSDSRIYHRYKNVYETSQDILETGEQYELPEDSATKSLTAMSERVALGD